MESRNLEIVGSQELKPRHQDLSNQYVAQAHNNSYTPIAFISSDRERNMPAPNNYSVVINNSPAGQHYAPKQYGFLRTLYEVLATLSVAVIVSILITGYVSNKKPSEIVVYIETLIAGNEIPRPGFMENILGVFK